MTVGNSTCVIRSSQWIFQRHQSGEKSKSHSLERRLSGILCLCWNCDAENSVMCFTGGAHAVKQLFCSSSSSFFLNTGVYGYHVNLTRSLFTDLFTSVSTDPAPVLEASHTLEGRLQQLQSSAPDGEALVREISGYWKKHLECLEKTGQPRIVYIREQSHLNGKSWPLLYRCWEVDLNVPAEKSKKYSPQDVFHVKIRRNSKSEIPTFYSTLLTIVHSFPSSNFLNPCQDSWQRKKPSGFRIRSRLSNSHFLLFALYKFPNLPAKFHKNPSTSF